MIKILHVSLEYIKGVGGIRTVTNGLLPALSSKGLEISILTPHYDIYEYTAAEQQHIATVRHTYKGVIHESEIIRVINIDADQNIVYHYLVKPTTKSPVRKIFEIGDELNIYQALKHSELSNRREYLNSVLAAFIRQDNPKVEIFDIIHLHSWNTGIGACLIKEYELINKQDKLRKIPHIITTIHMLSEHALGITKEVPALLKSFGLPADFAEQFSEFEEHISPAEMKQIVLALLYSDSVNTVSKGLARDVVNDKGFGLEKVFRKLQDEGRFVGITNGTTVDTWDATLEKNLHEFAFAPETILQQKLAIKQKLAATYSALDPNKAWFLYVGRLSDEKGIDMLASAMRVIQEFGCNLIVMGIHVNSDLQSPVRKQIEFLKHQKSVLVIDDAQEQKSVGKLIRAASEFTIVPSHIEACGLVPMESLNCASIPITSDVQGLCDVVVSLKDNYDNGTGFVYSDDPESREHNIQMTIIDALTTYEQLKTENKLSPLLKRLLDGAKSFDWKQKPAQSYVELYERLLLQHALTFDRVREIRITTPVLELGSLQNANVQLDLNVLHLAMEYKEATFGGLGSVATQMVTAQHEFNILHAKKINSSIITPLYSGIFKAKKQLIMTVEHPYNNKLASSNIFLLGSDNGNHYAVEPSGENKDLFNIDSINTIYAELPDSPFIERVKYFNSAAAAFIHKTTEQNSDRYQNIIIMHDWHAVLSAKLLSDYYNEKRVKSIFIVHVSSVDYGGYQSEQLRGIGLNFTPGLNTLKSIGLKAADKVVAVSPSFLKECMTVTTEDPIVNSIRKLFVVYNIQDQKVTCISNGFDYKSFCPIGRTIPDPYRISEGKYTIKKNLANMMNHTDHTWSLNPDLPVILYLGRFAPEKGVETFASVIKAIKNRAIFFALGRGVTDSVLDAINEHSEHTDNVFISYDQDVQKKYANMMRACADFTLVPSHRESFGLAPIEGFANGSVCISTAVGGLQDSVKALEYSDLNKTSGNGFIYKDQVDDQPNLELEATIDKALLFWSKLNSSQKDNIHLRLMNEARNFDWLAPGGSIAKYTATYEELANKAPSKATRLLQ